jgi:hypothetical protein
MNEERAQIINLVLRKQLSLADGDRLLDALVDLEADAREQLVEPPCPLPPWREVGDDFDALLSLDGCPLLLASATRRIARGLAEGDLWTVASRLAMLDVMELAEFWSKESRLGYMVGGVNLEEAPEGLKGRPGSGGRIFYSGDSLAMFFFWHPVPSRRPEELLRRERDEAGRRLEYTVHPERETVTTGLATFDDCLRVTHRFSPPAAETRTVWLARGVGPVRATFERDGGSRFAVELTECRTSGGESFLPREPGSRWQFEGTNGALPHRERWRALAPRDAGEPPWMSLAACPYPIEE